VIIFHASSYFSTQYDPQNRENHTRRHPVALALMDSVFVYARALSACNFQNL